MGKDIPGKNFSSRTEVAILKYKRSLQEKNKKKLNTVKEK
jgi:hypothetical protein